MIHLYREQPVRAGEWPRACRGNPRRSGPPSEVSAPRARAGSKRRRIGSMLRQSRRVWVAAPPESWNTAALPTRLPIAQATRLPPLGARYLRGAPAGSPRQAGIRGNPTYRGQSSCPRNRPESSTIAVVGTFSHRSATLTRQTSTRRSAAS